MAIMSILYERQYEQKELEALCHSAEAEFLAIYGRRRVGKTFLVSEYFSDKGIYFEVTGIHKGALSAQLDNFAIVFSDVFYRGKDKPQLSSWYDAFTLLRQQIETVPKQEKVILFFDELPWLAASKSEFLPALEHCWNRYLSRMSNVILIVCGSAASWMIDNIINNKGGLHGRLSKEMHLFPFNLSETENFLKARHIGLPRKDILEIYMAMGGVAKYLTQAKPGRSAAQIINDVCFSRNGYLFKEFEKLYASLFDNHEKHIDIVKQLATKRKGLTRKALLDKTGLTSGGTSSRILRELEASGFIMKVPSYDGRASNNLYRLSDEYSLFYLDWIEAAPDTSLQTIESDYWLKQRTSRRWSAWSGYVFEDICLKHADKIKAALGISGVSTTVSTWQNDKAQIDLVIERADNCINLCEIKFYNDEFIVDKDYADKLQQKKRHFQQATKTKKALFTTLITPYGVRQNQHYLESVQSQLTVDDLF
ncbi:MAG: ATPase [Legionellales bacterium]|nr:ATPase [Legionellales bacterium]|tara:strand:+ start:4491 stop:5930 length:1440 start_codon:yes stop_codon:yes gene_type:complete